MPKRKRSSYEDDADRVLQMRRKDVAEKLAQSKKLLHRALKTAKGFERQKLGKRVKAAASSNDNVEVARLNREIEALKGLDLDKATNAHLFKSLLKVKAIGDSELLPEEAKTELPRPEGTEEQRTALHNVTSGMYNTKPVKEVLGKIMSGMYIVLGIPAPLAKVKGGVKKERGKEISKNTTMGVPRRVDSEEKEILEEAGETGSGEPLWEAFDSGDEREDMDTEGGVAIDNKEDDDEDGGELDEATLSRYDDLIGGSSDEESFDESKYNINRSSRSQQPTRLPLSLSPTPSESDYHSQAQAQSPSPSSPPRKVAKTSKTKTKPPPAKADGSTFLPTLMGGYWSGSESSASDLEDNDVTSAPVRKNRPGQMARRAIWEKKFGEKANHIKSGKGPVPKGKKDDGWDAKRGAKETGRGEGNKRGGFRGTGRGGRDFRQATGENAVAVEPRKRGMGRRDDAGPLHPSWEAAKKAKEIKKTATFQGKKISFD